VGRCSVLSEGCWPSTIATVLAASLYPDLSIVENACAMQQVLRNDIAFKTAVLPRTCSTWRSSRAAAGHASQGMVKLAYYCADSSTGSIAGWAHDRCGSSLAPADTGHFGT